MFSMHLHSVFIILLIVAVTEICNILGNVTMLNGSSETSTVGLTTWTVPYDNNTSSTENMHQTLSLNSGTLLQTFYVLMGVTAVVMLYFVIRAVRVRCLGNRRRKYGLLPFQDNFEMKHLEDDEEDDATLFDRTMSKSRR